MENDLLAQEPQMTQEPRIVGTVISGAPNHPTTRVTGFGRWADVDTDLAPLIEKLWRLRIFTDNSCQDWSARPGCVWLSFDGSDDIHRFLLRVLDSYHPHSDFYQRVVWNNLYPQDESKVDDWRFRFFVEETSGYNRGKEPGKVYAIPTDYDYGPKAITSTIQVSFPRKDLLAVCQAFGVDVGYDPHWTHDLCGREYTDATREEIAIWTSRVACTGFCCDDCRAEHEEKDDDD